MYSCSHFSNCLSDDPDQIGKQSAMSKRGQKTTSNEGYPTAVLRAKRSEDISSRSLGSLVSPVNADARKVVVRTTRQLVLPDSNSNIGYSQASRQKKDTGAGGSKPNRK